MSFTMLRGMYYYCTFKLQCHKISKDDSEQYPYKYNTDPIEGKINQCPIPLRGKDYRSNSSSGLFLLSKSIDLTNHVPISDNATP